MNFTVVFKLLLVISIVLQSLSSVASTTSNDHKIDLEHLQTQHEHKNDIKAFDGNVDEEGHDIDDCHHCGHCSGSHLSWISISHTDTTASLYHFNKIPYLFDQTKEYVDAIQRPPIS